MFNRENEVFPRPVNLEMLLLAAERIYRRSPVTLGTIALNVVMFLISPLSSAETCVSWQYVWKQSQWQRLFLGAIAHADDIHLIYFNMISLLMKGRSLERRFKSNYFAYLLVVFTILTSITLVALNALLAHLSQDQSYLYECAVGFSGVTFALKVLTTHYSPPGTQYLLGFIPIPSKWIYWAELVLIQIIVPNASFTGHLAGILVGLAYVRGPLEEIMSMDIFNPPRRVPAYTYRAGRSGRAGDSSSSTGHRSGNSNHNSMPNTSTPSGGDSSPGSNSPTNVQSGQAKDPRPNTPTSNRGGSGSGWAGLARYRRSVPPKTRVLTDWWGLTTRSTRSGPTVPSYTYKSGRSGYRGAESSSTGHDSVYSNDNLMPNTSAPFGADCSPGSNSPTNVQSTPTDETTDCDPTAGATGTLPLRKELTDDSAQKLYPDPGTETTVNENEITEEEMMRILLQKSRYDK